MGCHFKNESIPIGKKPNSMIKPFPNKINMNVMKVIIENVGTVYLENVDNTNTASNKDTDADCGVSMSEDTFKQLISGEISGMAAFMQGKLDVKGDMSIAMHLGNFI